jgi:RimJ/RimL family protein N-acetyltransferase
MTTLLETPRLRLTRWRPDDLDLLVALSAMPEIVRYVGDGLPWPRERAVTVSERNLDHWHHHGFGWRVAYEKPADAPVGLIALNYAGPGTVGVSPGDFEVGWWLDPARWGHGLATEGARAIVVEAFGRIGAPSVIARIQPTNRASVRVAERLGMRLDLTTTGRYGEPVAVYRVSRGTDG